MYGARSYSGRNNADYTSIGKANVFVKVQVTGLGNDFSMFAIFAIELLVSIVIYPETVISLFRGDYLK